MNRMAQTIPKTNVAPPGREPLRDRPAAPVMMGGLAGGLAIYLIGGRWIQGLFFGIRFAEPVFIDAQQNFRVEMEIPDATALGELQRIYGPFFIWVTLDGYMRRDVQ